MGRISEKKLPEELKKEATAFLHRTIISINSKERSKVFLRLFTEKEKKNLLRRCAIAVLLLKEKTYREIGEVLKVSNTTISGIKKALRGEGYGYYDYPMKSNTAQLKYKTKQKRHRLSRLPRYKGWVGWNNLSK